MIRNAIRVNLVVLAVVGIAGGWTAAALNGPVADIGPQGAFLTVIVLAAQVAGWLIGRRQPRRWTGPLVQLIGVAAPLSYAREGDVGAAIPVLAVIWLATLLVPAALILGHPDGNAHRRQRLLLGVAVTATAVFAAPIVLAAHGRDEASATWWNVDRAFSGATQPAQTLFTIHTVVAAAALLWLAVVAFQRLARSDRAGRRLLRPVLVPGLAWAVVTAAGQAARIPGPGWALTRSGATASTYTAPATLLFEIVPILTLAVTVGGVVWVDLFVPRLQRTATGISVGARAGAEEMGEFLARGLADPSARVVFRDGGDVAWIDAAGRATTLTTDDIDRAVTVLQRDGVILGAIEHDAGLATGLDAVELIGTGAALAIDNERLVALANAKVEGARRLTARLVTAADAARDQLGAELAAGPLRELEEIAAMLAGDTDLAAVAVGLRHISGQVRQVSHGLFPPELIEEGLAAALPDATEVPAKRFAPAVEITAYLAAADDPGARISTAGGRLTIALTDPPIDPPLLDRIAVLGGTVEGTTIVLPV